MDDNGLDACRHIAEHNAAVDVTLLCAVIDDLRAQLAEAKARIDDLEGELEFAREVNNALRGMRILRDK
jgi:hypothetical protein